MSSVGQHSTETSCFSMRSVMKKRSLQNSRLLIKAPHNAWRRHRRCHRHRWHRCRRCHLRWGCCRRRRCRSWHADDAIGIAPVVWVKREGKPAATEQDELPSPGALFRACVARRLRNAKTKSSSNPSGKLAQSLHWEGIAQECLRDGVAFVATVLTVLQRLNRAVDGHDATLRQ